MFMWAEKGKLFIVRVEKTVRSSSCKIYQEIVISC